MKYCSVFFCLISIYQWNARSQKNSLIFWMNLKFEIVFVVLLVEAVSDFGCGEIKPEMEPEVWERLNPLAIKDLK